MGMIQLNMLDEDRHSVEVERVEPPHPRVQRKMETVSPAILGDVKCIAPSRPGINRIR